MVGDFCLFGFFVLVCIFGLICKEIDYLQKQVLKNCNLCFQERKKKKVLILNRSAY